MIRDASQPTYSDDVLAYLGRLYDESNREFACRAETPEQVADWAERARPALRALLGLDRIASSLANHSPSAQLDEPEDMGNYVRQKGVLQAEPSVWVPFWLLKPNGGGPFPLAVMPHGHDPRGYDTYVGIGGDEAGLKKIAEQDRDVAVQAVRQGYLTIAPATRGIGCDGVPDINKRHNDSSCRSQQMHCLVAGRTAMAERVWDMERFIDWAVQTQNVHSRSLLMMGNSGGGMVTTYAAACDTRVQIAVPSCSFMPYVRPTGQLSHCDCNLVPGILNFGEFHDVAGLIAPRHLLIVNGRHDPLHDNAHVDAAVAGVERIYAAAGVPDRFRHEYGENGHRFYKHLMWPFIAEARQTLES